MVPTSVKETVLRLYDRVKNFQSLAAIEYYAREFNLDIAVALEHFEEVVKYLCLSASTTEHLTPSDQLDEAWHAFLIQTRDYHAFSRKLGHLVHHTTTGQPRQNAYSKVIEYYRETFGELHSIWFSPKLARTEPTKIEEKDCPVCEPAGWCSDD